MPELVEFIHYATIALTVAINAVGTGIGQGLASSAAIKAIDQQPSARNDIFKVTVISIALIETSAVMGVFVSLLLLLGTSESAHNLYGGLAEIGITFAICLPGLILGIVSAFPAQAACMAVARQPFFTQRILRLMIIALSLIQTPIIFGLIVALFIRGQAQEAHTLRDALRLIGSGICIGVGSVGPALGLALFGRTACTGISINRKSYNQILSFTFISQAIIETPLIFALVVAISLLFLVPHSNEENVINGIVLLAAGLCTGIGTIGPGISSGKTASAACKQIAINPELQGTLSRLSLFAQGLIDTAAIYAVLISFFLLFVV